MWVLSFPEGRQFCRRARHRVPRFEKDSSGRPSAAANWKKGDIIIMNQIVLYDLDENGKFKRIRIFHHRYLDPKEVQLH